jgi:hypothetical protein
MHDWSEKDFDWNGLYSAIDEIYADLKKWRVPVRDWKEKYGTCRIYCSLGWNSLHEIVYPGHIYYRFPRWLVHMDIYYLSRIVRFFNFIVLPIHEWVYERAYRKATLKYPHLIREICCCADFVELLTFYKPYRAEDNK